MDRYKIYAVAISLGPASNLSNSIFENQGSCDEQRKDHKNEMATSSGKRKVKPGAIKLDDNDAFLLIDIETQILNADNQIVSRSQSQKRVELYQYLTAANLTDAAAEIVANCKYIHKSKVAHIEGLLKHCIERHQQKVAREAAPTAAIVNPGFVETILDKSDSESDADEKPGKPDSRPQRKPSAPKISKDRVDYEQISVEVKSTPKPTNAEIKIPAKPKRPRERASIDHLETYLELLYEENIDEVVRSTGLIAQLARTREYLDILCANGTAIGALTRILNENRKKNLDLIVNVLDIFRSISRYSVLHAILFNSKIGDTTMKILDLECKRYDLHQNAPSEKQTPKFLLKQQKVLLLAFSILLNLAEDAQIEVKMINRGIITYLVSTLARETKEISRSLTDLRLLVLTFLKKLSIMKENVDAMASSELIQCIALSDTSVSGPALTATLRLLFNLSFHAGFRDLILKDPAFLVVSLNGLRSADEIGQLAAIRFLYNLSVNEKGRAVVASDGNIIKVVTELIIDTPTRQIPNDLIGLAISLSTIDACASVMCEKEAISALVKRALTTTDVLLMKLLHNLSVHPSKGKEHLSRYLADFISLAKRSQRNEFLVETLGIIGNLDQPGTSFARVVTNSDFIDFIVKHLIPGFTDDDIVLAVVIVIGTLALDPHCAPVLINPRLVRLLADTLEEKCDDEEIVLQTVFSISRLMCYDEIRNLLLAIPSLIDKLVYIHKTDTNASIQVLAAQCITIAIAQASETDREKIKSSIFELHNYEWLKMSSACNEEDNRPNSSAFSEDKGGWNSRELSPVGRWPESPALQADLDYEFCD